MAEADATWASKTLFGTFYPKGYVIAVVEDGAAADPIVDAVRAAGFGGEDVRVWSGEEVLATHDRFVKERNPLQRIGGVFPSEEAAILQEYLESARAGNRFLTIHAPGHADAARVAAVLADQPIAVARHYGDRTITDLD